MNLKSILKSFRNKSEDINIQELKDILKKNTDIVLLDVRSIQEFMEEHLNRCYKHTII